MLLKVDSTFRARNRHNKIAFAQQPSEGHLAWLCTDGRGDVPHDLNRIHVGVEVLTMEARIELAGVLRWIFLRTLDATCQEPPAKRAEGNKANSEFPQHGNDLAFEIALPQGI